MSKLEMNEKFDKYRKERILKECSVCSDLYHGYQEGYLQSNFELKQQLAATQRKLDKMIEAFDVKTRVHDNLNRDYINKREKLKKLEESIKEGKNG